MPNFGVFYNILVKEKQELDHGIFLFSGFQTYPRGTYTFNMCFVVPRDDKNADSVYEPIVQKCAEYLIELEQVSLFILISFIFHSRINVGTVYPFLSV